MVSGQLPIEAIDDLAALDSLQFARPAYALTNVGLVDSQGDAAMRTDVARATFGVDGTGITVGTMSDSFNQLGGAPGDVASGDLPGGIIVLDDSALCPPPPPIGSGICTDEGRGMMQLIADVAPGASQAFHTAFNGQADFALGIQELAGCPPGSTAGCTPAPGVAADVIVDDVINFAEPMFQDGIIAQAVDTVKSAGVSYFSSAGNSGRDSYESPFRPSGIIDSASGDELHDFDPGLGVDTCQSITIPAGPGIATIFSFQWDEPFFSVSGAPGSANDMNWFFYADTDCTSFLGFGGFDANIGGDPVEVPSIGAAVVVPTTFTIGIAIGKSSPGSTPDPGLMKYVAFSTSAFSIDEYDTASSTVYGHANAAGAEAVGAAFYFQTPEFGTSPPVLEPFSSAGPTPILFDTSGNPINEIRQKPEIVAPDGTDTTFFPPPPFGADVEPNSFPNFFGTSAAALHAAGVAALMLSTRP